MKLTKVLLCIAAVALSTVSIVHALPSQMAPLHVPHGAVQLIPDKFIVVLRDPSSLPESFQAASPDALYSAHRAWLDRELAYEQSLVAEDLYVEHEYSLGERRGYSGRFSTSLLNRIRAMPDVDYVEQDQVMSVSQQSMPELELKVQFYRHSRLHSLHKVKHREDPEQPDALPKKTRVQTDSPSWGLARVAHRELPTAFDQYEYPRKAGEGVDVYVIDTGINVEHEDFGGRAIWGKTIPYMDKDVDGNGHGTHCAGTIAGEKFGIAKNANVVAVKVLRTNGFGSNSDVIRGIQWVADAHTSKVRSEGATARRSAANMSLGGGLSKTLDMALDKTVSAGVHVAVAAGNDNADACNYSPAAADAPLTVGASTISDSRAYFSNHGPCVDVFAPGLDITSAWIGGKDAVKTISGTSMASPHVAGVLALYLGEREHTTEELKARVLKHATKDLLSDLPEGTVNLLVTSRKLLK